MKISYREFNPGRFFILAAIACMLLAGGCARYARNVNALYEPGATVRSGSGEIHVIIPESQQTQSADIKWVFGKVKNDENKQIDEVFSPRSAAEVIQSALGLELRKAGYTIIPATKRTGAEQQAIDLAKTEIELEQISDLADLKAKCRVLVGVDVFRDGQLIKKLQYESTSSKTDIKDRDMLAGNVLQDALQSVMLKAVPEIHNLFKR